jgi:hypothetical protein
MKKDCAPVYFTRIVQTGYSLFEEYPQFGNDSDSIIFMQNMAAATKKNLFE